MNIEEVCRNFLAKQTQRSRSDIINNKSNQIDKPLSNIQNNDLTHLIVKDDSNN